MHTCFFFSLNRGIKAAITVPSAPPAQTELCLKADLGSLLRYAGQLIRLDEELIMKQPLPCQVVFIQCCCLKSYYDLKLTPLAIFPVGHFGTKPV